MRRFTFSNIRTESPGLTLVVGRNGSGKSSFAEALELLLTGNTFRWSQRTFLSDFALEGERGSSI